MPVLDGFRGVAVACVMWDHLGPQIAIPPAPRMLAAFGVEMFFVLSGFLITRILLFNREQGIGLGAFYKRRMLRILPAFWVMLLLFGWMVSPREWVLAATYTWNLLPGEGGISPFGHVWSLCVEEHFYLLWPLVVLLLSPWLSVRVAVVGLVASLAAAWWVETQNLWAGRPGTLGMSPVTWFRAPPLMAGAVLAHLEHVVVQRRGGLVAGVTLAAMATVAYEAMIVFGREFGLGYEGPVMIFWRCAMATAVFLVVVSHGLPWITEALSGRGIGYVGRISYGLYLFHLPIYMLVGTMESVPGLSVVKVLAGVGLTFLLAAASHRFIEMPLLEGRWRRRSPLGPIHTGTQQASTP